MRIKRSIVIPLVLLVYLAAMASLGYKDYSAGRTGALQYFGVIGVTLVILVALHFSLRRREQLRKERLDDIDKNNKDK